MADLTVGPGFYPNTRSAINASASGDKILFLTGTFDVTSFPGGAPATLAYTDPAFNIFSSTGFNPVTYLLYEGAGRSGASAGGTTLTGNARLYVSSQDGGLDNSPTSLSYKNFEITYTNPSYNYILQVGRAGTTADNTMGTTVALTQTKSITIDNVLFSGVHPGNTGASGNYVDIAGIQSFAFTNNIVSLTDQGTFDETQVVSGGSSFLLLQGGQMGAISITGNQFTETGYRNGLSIYDSTNVTLSGNTFSRAAGSRFVRTNNAGIPKSNKISNSTNVTIGGSMVSLANTFTNGSFLSLDRGSGAVQNNTFDGSVMEANSPPALGIYLEGPPVPAYTYTSNTFKYVSPFVNATGTPVFVTTNSTNDNFFVNPNNGNSVAVQQIITGTSASETLTSMLPPGAPSRRDLISGGLGNDTLDGGSGTTAILDNDFFLFDTTPNSSTNWDTIVNWTASLSGAQRDQLVLSRAIFKNIITTSGVAGLGGLNGIGILAQATAGGGQMIANATGSFTSSTSLERIALDNSGADQGTLYYQAGDGSPAVRFARLSTSPLSSPSPTWVSTLTQLGSIAVI